MTFYNELSPLTKERYTQTFGILEGLKESLEIEADVQNFNSVKELKDTGILNDPTNKKIFETMKEVYINLINDMADNLICHGYENKDKLLYSDFIVNEMFTVLSCFTTRNKINKIRDIAQANGIELAYLYE